MADISLAMFLERKLNLGKDENIHSNYYNTAKIDVIAEQYKLDELIESCLTGKEYKAIFKFLKARTSYSMTRTIVKCTTINDSYISNMLSSYTPYKDKSDLFHILISDEMKIDLAETFTEELITHYMRSYNPKKHIELDVIIDAYLRLAITTFAYDILEIISTTFTKEDKN